MSLGKMCKKFLKTLAVRLTLWYAAIFLLLFATAFLFLYHFINFKLDERMDQDLLEDISEFVMMWDEQGMPGVHQEIQHEMFNNDSDDVLLRILDPQGQILFTPNAKYWKNLKTNAAWLQSLKLATSPFLTTIQIKQDEPPMRMALGYIAPGIILQVGESMEEKQSFMALIFMVFLTTFLVFMLLATWAGWFMAKRALHGVQEVSRAAVDIANGSLDRKVEVNVKGTEIEQLVATFNAMIERIRRLISGMREMTDNIAHDMRSPLARIRANAELALSNAKTIEEFKTSSSETLEECDRLLQMINTTLDVVEAEAGTATTNLEAINITTLANEAYELFEPVAEDKNIEIVVNIQPNCRVKGHPRNLQRVLANLLDNALKFTPPSGRVEIAVSNYKGNVSTIIRDSGVGIAEIDLPHIFERFFRCDQSRSKPGFGLGLSFVRAVVNAHGGSVDVTSRRGSEANFGLSYPLQSNAEIFEGTQFH